MLHGWPKLIKGQEVWISLGQNMSLIGIDFAPLFWGLMAAISEFFGGLFLFSGIFTRYAAFFMIPTMLIATLVHINKGDTFQGYSHAITMAGVFIALTFIGAGQYSIDGKLRKKP